MKCKNVRICATLIQTKSITNALIRSCIDNTKKNHRQWRLLKVYIIPNEHSRSLAAITDMSCLWSQGLENEKYDILRCQWAQQSKQLQLGICIWFGEASTCRTSEMVESYVGDIACKRSIFRCIIISSVLSSTRNHRDWEHLRKCRLDCIVIDCPNMVRR